MDGDWIKESFCIFLIQFTIESVHEKNFKEVSIINFTRTELLLVTFPKCTNASRRFSSPTFDISKKKNNEKINHTDIWRHVRHFRELHDTGPSFLRTMAFRMAVKKVACFILPQVTVHQHFESMSRISCFHNILNVMTIWLEHAVRSLMIELKK